VVATRKLQPTISTTCNARAATPATRIEYSA
jgi:hypothetical protein